MLLFREVIYLARFHLLVSDVLETCFSRTIEEPSRTIGCRYTWVQDLTVSRGRLNHREYEMFPLELVVLTMLTTHSIYVVVVISFARDVLYVCPYAFGVMSNSRNKQTNRGSMVAQLNQPHLTHSAISRDFGYKYESRSKTVV